jgi:hypothetical protein
MGAKFSAFALEEVQACAEFCDVISFDDYQPRLDPATWGFLNQFGKPAILAEFGFAATDRGGFSGGLAPVASQAAKALSYGLKVQDAMTNPDFVGANWYEYVDDPITGSISIGENTAWGFVSVTDSPYPELTAFASSVNTMLYGWRTSALASSEPDAAVVTGITPSRAIVGGSDFLLRVSGSNFAASSIVQWNGSGRQTLVAGTNQLWAVVSASDIAAAGAAQVTVFTPAPGGGTSNAQTFSVQLMAEQGRR